MNFEEAKIDALEFFKGDELAADTFLKKYALTSKDGKTYFESTPKQTWRRLAKAGASVEENKEYWEEKFYKIFEDFKAVPQGSIMFALGNPYQKSSASNCFVFDVDDSIESIFDTAKEMARTYSYRGGCGLDISKLRPSSALVSNAAKSSSGASSFMDFYSYVTRMMGQNGRRGALMLTIDVSHPDIEQFIKMKHDLTKVTGANVSVKLTDKFMEAVEQDQDWVATFVTEHETIERKWKARELWGMIVESATKTAEPGLLFWDNVLNNSPADSYADVGFRTTCTNPCSELPLAPYDACTLLTMNLTKYTRNDFTENSFFDEKAFLADTEIATRFLDNVKTIDSELVPLDKQKDMAQRGRRIGMGIHGLGDTLANLRIKYDSEEGIDFIGKLFEKYTKKVYATSVELGKEKGIFPIFDAEKEKDNNFLQRIGYHGVPRRNIACMTVAPTGSVGILCQTSSGIEPVFRNSYRRRTKVHNNQDIKEGAKYFVDALGDRWLEYEVYHHNVKRYIELTGNTDLPDYFVTSDQIDWEKRVRIQAAITYWLDHSCSSTINLPKGTSTDIVSKIYFEAHKSGCKGITVYVDGSRDGVLITEESSKEDFQPKSAFKRPRKIPCDIYKIQADGEKWVVLIGLVDGKPYEVFCGKPNGIEFNKVDKGYIEKEVKGKYSLHIGEDLILKDISQIFTDIQGSMTRLISTSLRHGVDIHFVVQQLEKSDGAIHSFGKAISRVLKKYIKDGTKESGSKCPSCGQESLIREEGCVKCTSCGWTKCN